MGIDLAAALDPLDRPLDALPKLVLPCREAVSRRQVQQLDAELVERRFVVLRLLAQVDDGRHAHRLEAGIGPDGHRAPDTS